MNSSPDGFTNPVARRVLLFSRGFLLTFWSFFSVFLPLLWAICLKQLSDFHEFRVHLSGSVRLYLLYLARVAFCICAPNGGLNESHSLRISIRRRFPTFRCWERGLIESKGVDPADSRYRSVGHGGPRRSTCENAALKAVKKNHLFVQKIKK